MTLDRKRRPMRGGVLILGALVASVCTACAPLLSAFDTKQSGSDRAAQGDVENLEGHEKPLTCADSHSAVELVALGNAELNKAINHVHMPLSVNLFSGGELDDSDMQPILRDARDCFARARDLAPNNYVALLGLGIANTLSAMVSSQDTNAKRTYLQSAKLNLGKAFLVRNYPFEPIYYLAHAFIIEGQDQQAETLLKVLIRAQYKVGSAHLVLAEIASKRRNERAAEAEYRRVLEVGASGSELAWAASRITQIQEGRRN